jgi:hypothetical protein
MVVDKVEKKIKIIQFFWQQPGMSSPLSYKTRLDSWTSHNVGKREWAMWFKTKIKKLVVNPSMHGCVIGKSESAPPPSKWKIGGSTIESTHSTGSLQGQKKSGHPSKSRTWLSHFSLIKKPNWTSGSSFRNVILTCDLSTNGVTKGLVMFCNRARAGRFT